ncbi:MAG: hypothetical protein H7281_01210 [Bacteriovorax sp.]|nr:hypothetical protein [Bacteriovorax sp.]
MKNLRLVSILSLLLLFFACSRIDLAANWADTYISHQIDHYFDMNSLQSKLLKKSLKEDIKEVRKIIFPKLALDLERIDGDVEGATNFNVQKLESYKVNLRKTFDEGLIIFEPSAQEFVNQLNASQLESFKKEFDKKTKDIESEASEPVTAKDKRFNKIREQLEGWLGILYPEQRKDIQIFCNANPFPFREQVLNRNKLSREFLEAFPNTEKRKKFIHQLFYNYESMREPSYAKVIDEDQQKYFELISVILNKMSNEQKKRLSKTLKDRVEQLNKSSLTKKSSVF